MPDAWVVVLVSTLSATPAPPAAPATAAAAVEAVPPAPRMAYQHGARHFLDLGACEATVEARPVPAGHRLVCLQYGAGEELMQAAAW